MAVGGGAPGVEVSMAIPTTAALAQQQRDDISTAINTGGLSTQWGQLGQPPFFVSTCSQLKLDLLVCGQHAEKWRAVAWLLHWDLALI